jgi:outer membrane protein assembly factor BamB
MQEFQTGAIPEVRMRILRAIGLLIMLCAACEAQVKQPGTQTSQREPGQSIGATGTSPTGTNETLPNLWTRRSGEDWPQFLGPSGNSKSRETGLVAPWPKEGPHIVWAKEVGTGYGIGSIAAGRYFQFDRHDVRRDRGSARLTCLQAETGEELWRFEYLCAYRDMLGYNNGPRASPVIDGNRVYIYGVEGMLHCLDASNGKLIWKVDTATKFGVVQNFFGVGSTPLVHGELLICMVGGSPPGSRGLYESSGAVEGNGSGVVAFDKLTGDVRYSVTDELASYASPQLTNIGNRDWCFVFCRGGLVALEPRTGKVDFHHPWRSELLESVNASTPVIVGNEVFISETYQIGSCLLSIDRNGYKVVWEDSRRVRDKSFRAHWNTPIYVDGYLYGCSGRNAPDAELRCIDWKTGKVQWSEFTGDRSSLLFVDGYLISLSEYGKLQLFRPSPQKHDVVSEVNVRPGRFADDPGSLPADPYWAAPILSHGLLYFRGDQRVVCMEVIPAERAR